MPDDKPWPIPGRHPGGRTCKGAFPLIPYYVLKAIVLAVGRVVTR